MNISNPNRPLATKNPTFDDLLPVDDKLWDDGVRVVASSFIIKLIVSLDCKAKRRFQHLSGLFTKDGHVF